MRIPPIYFCMHKIQAIDLMFTILASICRLFTLKRAVALLIGSEGPCSWLKQHIFAHAGIRCCSWFRRSNACTSCCPRALTLLVGFWWSYLLSVINCQRWKFKMAKIWNTVLRAYHEVMVIMDSGRTASIQCYSAWHDGSTLSEFCIPPSYFKVIDS